MTAPAVAPPRKRTQGPRVIRFIEHLCVHPEGDLVDQPLILHPFWKQRITEMFEVLPRQCPHCGALETFVEASRADVVERHVGWEDAEGWLCTTCEGLLESLPPDQRRYSEVLIGTPKKQAKSTVLKSVGLYLLIADNDPAAHGVCAAASENQSKNLLFGFARYDCQPSPQRHLPHPLAEVTEAFQTEIVVKGLPRSRLRNVTSAVGTNDGPVLKFAMCDELHEWKGQAGRDLYTVISKGLATRDNAMLIAITTAGYDEDSLEFERYSYGRKVRSGEIDDPRFYFYWLEAPDGCDYRDRKIWRAVNPLLGVTIKESYLEDQVNRNPEGSFRRYNLNQHTAGEEIWIPHGAWDECENHEFELEPDRPLYVCIDMAASIDSSAVGMVQVVKEWMDEEGEKLRLFVCRARIWENPYLRSDPRWASWRMNPNEVKQFSRELFAAYPVPAAEVDGKIMVGPAFLFDPWRFREEANTLFGEGLHMIEFPQTDTYMVPASQALYEAIMFHRIVHDGAEDLKRHMNNCTAEARPRGFRIDRPTGARKPNDGAITIAGAIFQAMKGAPVVTKARGSWV